MAGGRFAERVDVMICEKCEVEMAPDYRDNAAVPAKVPVTLRKDQRWVLVQFATWFGIMNATFLIVNLGVWCGPITSREAYEKAERDRHYTDWQSTLDLRQNRSVTSFESCRRKSFSEGQREI